MLNRLIVPAAAAILGAAALAPVPANASWASAPASITHANAQNISDVVEVRRRDRRRYSHRHRRWHRPYFAAPYYFAPYAYAPRRCGYVWNHRTYRNIWRCW